jgi:Uma2 family endonuclease
MTVLPWPDHLLTMREWEDLPEDNSRRYELVEGVMQVSPRPIFTHQRAVWKVAAQLDAALPEHLEALPEVEVVIVGVHPPTIRVPDVVVVPSRLANEGCARCRASDVLLAVEIISPGTGRTDRVAKFFEYSEAGIPDYWIVELDGEATLSAYRLVDGEYEFVAHGGGKQTLSRPAPVTLDVDSLTRLRG